MGYYSKISVALKYYEEYRPYPTHSLEWISNRISWCWKFRKISKSEMEELADRTTKCFNERR